MNCDQRDLLQECSFFSSLVLKARARPGEELLNQSAVTLLSFLMSRAPAPSWGLAKQVWDFAASYKTCSLGRLIFSKGLLWYPMKMQFSRADVFRSSTIQPLQLVCKDGENVPTNPVQKFGVNLCTLNKTRNSKSWFG